MITDDMIRQKYTTVIHPNRLLLLHRKKDRSEAENLEMARLQYFIEHAQAPAVPGPEAPYPETPFKNNPPMLILGNPMKKSALLREARESARMAASDVKAGHKGAAKYWEGRAAGLAQAALQNPSVRVVPWSAGVWCIERWDGRTWTCACPRHGHYRSMREAEEVATREFGASPVRWGPPYGAHPVKRNPGGELECQYCGSGELVYMGQIGPNHAYRCRRCGMDLVVDIPPNPEYLARYISPSSEVREEVIRARGTRDAMKKAQRRADKLPPEFTAPRSSVEVAPIGGPNPKVRRGPQLSVPEQHQLRIARQTLQMPDPIAAVMGGPTKAQSREIIRRLTRRSNPAGQYEVVFRSAGERWYSGPFRTREDAEAYAKLGESGWYGPRGDWKRAPLQWRVVPSTSRQGPVQVLWPNPYVAVDRMSGRVSSVQRGRDKGAAYESIKDWAEDISQYSGRAQDVYWKRHDSKRLKVGIPAPEDMMAANPSRLRAKFMKPLQASVSDPRAVPFNACYYDMTEFGSVWITGKDRVPRWVCRRHIDVAREDTGRPNYNYRVFNRPRRRNPCGGRGANVDHHGIPGYIWNDPRFQAELRAYKRRHGTGPVEIRGIKVPKGYPKFMSVYGRAPHAVYDAPSHSTKGKRIHHFGGRGKSQPWLVSSVERGPKFLAYVGGTFRARPDWLYD